MNISNVTEALLRAHSVPPQEQHDAKPPFTITISREVGALGNAVGAELGRQLEWPVYNQEIIQKIAEELRQPSFEISDIDERKGWFQEFLTNLSSTYHVSATTYLKRLIGIVRGLGVIGKCIIVGRGANFILPRETTLSVRLVSNLPDRITVLRRLKGFTEREAVHYIDKTERDRVNFVKTSFDKDPADPHFYDLVVNTSYVGAEEATQIIINTLRVFENRREQSAPKETESLVTG